MKNKPCTFLPMQMLGT